MLSAMPLLTKSSPRVQRAVACMVLAAFFALGIAMTVAPPDAYIQGTPEQAGALAELNAGDISFMLASTALVLIMTPGESSRLGLGRLVILAIQLPSHHCLRMHAGVAFFYGGMISGKNTISTIALAIAPLALIPVIWSFIGCVRQLPCDLGAPLRPWRGRA